MLTVWRELDGTKREGWREKKISNVMNELLFEIKLIKWKKNWNEKKNNVSKWWKSIIGIGQKWFNWNTHTDNVIDTRVDTDTFFPNIYNYKLIIIIILKSLN